MKLARPRVCLRVDSLHCILQLSKDVATALRHDPSIVVQLGCMNCFRLWVLEQESNANETSCRRFDFASDGFEIFVGSSNLLCVRP